MSVRDATMITLFEKLKNKIDFKRDFAMSNDEKY